MEHAKRKDDFRAGRLRCGAVQVPVSGNSAAEPILDPRFGAKEEHGHFIAGVRNALIASVLFWLPVVLLLIYWS